MKSGHKARMTLGTRGTDTNAFSPARTTTDKVDMNRRYSQWPGISIETNGLMFVQALPPRHEWLGRTWSRAQKPSRHFSSLVFVAVQSYRMRRRCRAEQSKRRGGTCRPWASPGRTAGAHPRVLLRTCPSLCACVRVAGACLSTNPWAKILRGKVIVACTYSKVLARRDGVSRTHTGKCAEARPER